MVLRLWVPLIHWLWARNWKLAASGACLTASRVAKRVAVSTPLRMESLTWAVVSVVVILVCLLAEGWLLVAGVRSGRLLVRCGLLCVSAVLPQAVASRRWAGIGRAASAAACLSMAALSCF